MSDLREALKPCPFCGGSNITAMEKFDWVCCEDCGAALEDSEPNSVVLWNTRAALAQPEAVEPVAYLHTTEWGDKSVSFEPAVNPQWKDTPLFTTPPLAPDGERMRRALETIVFHCTISTEGNDIPTGKIQEVALEALVRADEGKESEGGDKPLQDGEVGGSEQPFSAGARQGREIPQSSKPKAECAGSISAAPLPSDPTPQDATVTVSRSGIAKLMDAVEHPKQPTEKLKELMREHRLGSPDATPQREAIARIIDPVAFDNTGSLARRRQSNALAKADAILALQTRARG